METIFKKPLVVDFRNLWADNLSDSAPTMLHHFLSRILEKRIIRSANRIVTFVDYASEHYPRRHGLNKKKVVTITNGFDPADQERFRSLGSHNHSKFKIIYTGSVFAFRSPDNFLKVLTLGR